MISDIHEAIDHVKHRNVLRASSGLPLLPVEQEVRGTILHGTLLKMNCRRELAGIEQNYARLMQAP